MIADWLYDELEIPLYVPNFRPNRSVGVTISPNYKHNRSVNIFLGKLDLERLMILVSVYIEFLEILKSNRPHSRQFSIDP